MKKFQFLLLDAGPIIKLFELGKWDDFIEKCDVTISQTVANEAKYASQDYEDICIDLEPYKEQELVTIIDLEASKVKAFYDKFNLQYKAIVHSGEKESLAFLLGSSEDWKLCSTDQAVFRVLGLLGKGEQGISLEEILEKTGLSQSELEWQYTKKFREKWTHKGKVDFVQGQSLL